MGDGSSVRPEGIRPESDINAPGFWDAAYREDRDNWDMGTPTPVFTDLLERLGMDLRELGGPDFSHFGRAPRVLVPCSGRGYDALLFAERGWETTALDFSAEPLQWLESEQKKRGLELRILQEDMFSLGTKHPAHYDLLLEYTCVCAIEPVRRTEFLAFAAEVLRPGGALLALLFPVDGRPGGPPFSIDVEEFKREAEKAFTLAHESTPETSVKPRRGRERLLLFVKKEEVKK
ncbi:MAG: methyltransferase domain-containing protein [Bacteroidetes bacterium]|nr:methyltransferase domain-containing protein [Bacteroidota bacterium]